MVEEKTKEILNYTEQLEETEQLCHRYSKTCFKRSLKNRQNKCLNDKWLLNEDRKYCRMLQVEHIWAKIHFDIITNLALSQKNEIEKWPPIMVQY